MHTETPLRIVVGAAYPMVREGLRALLQAQGEVVTGMAATPHELLELALSYQPVVAVLDRHLEDGTPGDAVRLLSAEAPDVAILVLSEPGAEEETLEALHAGARGYIWRGATAEELVTATRSVAAGNAVLAHGGLMRAVHAAARSGDEPVLSPTRHELTPRESDVLGLMAQGLPNKAIAHSLSISESTVKYHIAAILAKLGASSRTEAVAMAYRRGLLAL